MSGEGFLPRIGREEMLVIQRDRARSNRQFWHDRVDLDRLRATDAVLAEREAELLELRGPCSNKRCRLYFAHRGPCDVEVTP